MPTPFMHLRIAEEICSQVKRGANLRLQEYLGQEWPAFYMGSVAADFQTICNIPRADTHFYDLPPGPDHKAYSVMLASYPELANVSALSLDHAIFLSAYAVHLRLDLLWFRQVLMPYFVEASDWGDFPRRRLVHDILLTYLDKLAFDALPQTAGNTLAAAHPHHWLPFAADADLISWRDMLVDQLQGATPHTVEIYAERLGMSQHEFAGKLQDPEWIEEQVFSNVPVAEVQGKLETAVPMCINQITDYLQLNEQLEG
jgi:hypothetical protein